MDTINRNDVSALVERWKSQQREELKMVNKPVVVFIGKVGTGKSSCIKVIGNVRDENLLKDMNIGEGEKSQTVRKVVIDSPEQFLTLVDMRGKEDTEVSKTYMEDVLKMLRGTRIDLFIGVVKAYENRTTDLEALVNCLEVLLDATRQTPFIVLMNRFDEVKEQNMCQFNRRKASLEQMCQKLKSGRAWTLRGHASLGHGVFAVSADPTVNVGELCGNCVNTLPTSSGTSTTRDYFDTDTGVRQLIPGVARFCNTCKTAVICRSALSSDEYKGLCQQIRNRGGRIQDISPGPYGLDQHSPAIKCILNLVNDMACVGIIKSICETSGKRIESVGSIIRKAMEKIYDINDAKEQDGILCNELANLFDLPLTGLIQSKFEVERWREIALSEKVVGWVRRNFSGKPDKASGEYVAAWAIHYACKFRDIIDVLTDAYGKNPTNNVDFMVNECTKKLNEHPDELHMEYFNYIVNNGLDSAFNEYLVYNKS